MISRRTFLHTALAASVLPTLRWADAAPRYTAGLQVVVDGACSDARSFVEQCGVRPLIGSDTAALLATLLRDETRACFGLTRDSQYFLIEQMAGACGYRHGYHGVHDYRDGGLRHHLHGARDRIDGLAQALRDAGQAWAVPLAAAMPALARDSTRDTRIATRGDASRPADSGGYLVSWCLHRA